MKDNLTETTGDLQEVTSDAVETTPESENDVDAIIKQAILDSQKVEDQTPEPSDEEDDEIDDTAEPEEEDAEEPELNDSDEDEPELKSDDPDGLDARFTIDNSILDSLGDNAKAKARLEQQVAGWKKLAERYDREDVQKLVKNQDYLMALHQNFQMAQNDPAKFLVEYDKFIQQKTGFRVADYITDDDVSDVSEKPRSDVNVAELVNKQVQEALKPYQEEQEAKKKAREMESYLDDAYKQAHELLKKTCRGWEITRDMVRIAVENIPSLKNKPATAVKKWFDTELQKHYATAISEKKQAPNMVESAGRKKSNAVTELTSLDPEEIRSWIANELAKH